MPPLQADVEHPTRATLSCPARSALAVALCLAAAAPCAARALDRFEIQVYTADVNEPGHFGLEAHLNYTPSGIRSPEHPGAVPPNGTGRLTLEPSYGVTDWLELGAYVQFLAAPGGRYRYGGNKLRTKFVVPEKTQREHGIPVFLGLNAELSWVPTSVEQDAWATEFRPIVGWTDGRFLVSVNPIFGFTLTGPDRFRPDLEPCGKVAWNTQHGFSVGVEYYAGLGSVLDGFSPWDEQAHLVLGVIDLVEAKGGEPSAWELNVGAGAGLTSATGQHGIVKMIVGRSF